MSEVTLSGIRCGHCDERHSSVAEVGQCGIGRAVASSEAQTRLTRLTRTPPGIYGVGEPVKLYRLAYSPLGRPELTQVGADFSSSTPVSDPLSSLSILADIATNPREHLKMAAKVLASSPSDCVVCLVCCYSFPHSQSTEAIEIKEKGHCSSCSEKWGL